MSFFRLRCNRHRLLQQLLKLKPEKDSIGKRYRRQDAIGTPFCITVDHQTLEDNCVTLRNRDTMEQERVAISELNNIIADRVSITSLLKTL